MTSEDTYADLQVGEVELSALEIVQAQLRATRAELRDVVTENIRLRTEVARLTAPEALDRLSLGKNDSFDELVASHVAVHLEMLDRDEAYLNIYRTDQQEKFAQVLLRADGDVLRITVEDYGVWK